MKSILYFYRELSEPQRFYSLVVLAIIATVYVCFSLTNNSQVVEINKSGEQTLFKKK